MVQSLTPRNWKPDDILQADLHPLYVPVCTSSPLSSAAVVLLLLFAASLCLTERERRPLPSVVILTSRLDFFLFFFRAPINLLCSVPRWQRVGLKTALHRPGLADFIYLFFLMWLRPGWARGLFRTAHLSGTADPPTIQQLFFLMWGLAMNKVTTEVSFCCSARLWPPHPIGWVN